MQWIRTQVRGCPASATHLSPLANRRSRYRFRVGRALLDDNTNKALTRRAAKTAGGWHRPETRVRLAGQGLVRHGRARLCAFPDSLLEHRLYAKPSLGCWQSLTQDFSRLRVTAPFPTNNKRPKAKVDYFLLSACRYRRPVGDCLRALAPDGL